MIITLKEYEYGGKIEAYQMVDQTANDFDKVYACCDYFAKKGAKTLIYPRFTNTAHPDYAIIYASLRNTQYWGKCPDFTVNGVWYEHEGFDESKDLTDLNKRADTFSKMMNRGLKQSGRLIIEDCQVGRRWAKKTIYNRIHRENQNITEVYIRTSDGLELLYKKESGLT
jgi:hypothetical protein